MLVTSNFSFSHSVFKRIVFQGHQKVSLCGNGLTHYHIMPHFDAYIAEDNIVRKKKKLLVTSNFSFSHNVFYPIWLLFFILNAI